MSFLTQFILKVKVHEVFVDNEQYVCEFLLCIKKANLCKNNFLLRPPATMEVEYNNQT